MTTENLTHLSKIIRARHSEHVAFDPACTLRKRSAGNPRSGTLGPDRTQQQNLVTSSKCTPIEPQPGGNLAGRAVARG
jgi:hypothetical protein